MKNRSSGGCSSFLFLLFFIFLALKLTGHIDWSWWWVTSPLWLPAVVVLLGLAVLAVTGVSVYKVVTAVLRKQTAKQSAQGGQASTPDARGGEVLDAEGSEVTTPSGPGREAPAQLPAAPAGGAADSPVNPDGGTSA